MISRCSLELGDRAVEQGGETEEDPQTGDTEDGLGHGESEMPASWESAWASVLPSSEPGEGRWVLLREF